MQYMHIQSCCQCYNISSFRNPEKGFFFNKPENKE